MTPTNGSSPNITSPGANSSPWADDDPGRPFDVTYTPDQIKKRRDLNLALFDRKLENTNPWGLAPNTCTRNVFINPTTGRTFSTICDSPRCPDCGPHKQVRLIEGLEQAFPTGALLIEVEDDDHYRRIRDRIRYHRRRLEPGQQLEYESFVLDGRRYVYTDAPLDEGQWTQIAVFKKRLLTAYEQGKAGLRKSWGIMRLTLSSLLSRKSVSQSEWSWYRGETDIGQGRRLLRNWLEKRSRRDQPPAQPEADQPIHARPTPY